MDGVRVADMAKGCRCGLEVQPKCMLVFSSVSGLAH